MNPTKEQEQELWIWCGFELWQGSLYWYPDDTGARRLPNLYSIEAMGNLFKYAVPKLEDGIDIRFSKFDDTEWFVRLENQVMTTEDEDPALALFWACYEVMKK